MKVLFTTFHPVDPQIVFNVAKSLINNNHVVLFVVIEKEGIIVDLIKSHSLKVKKIGKTRKSLLGKIFNAFLIEIRLLKICLKFKPDIIFSPTSPYTGHVSKLLGIKHVCWADTETANINLNLSLPFIDTLLIPNCFYKKVKSKKVIFFNSYKEFAYLHPNWFNPNENVLKILGLSENDKIVLMRFSALNAAHDIGLKSKADDYSEKILYYVKELSKYAKVFISCTEKDLGPDFEPYKLNIHPSLYIHLLSYCTLYIGEGTTTASEAGVLGVPWIALRPLPLGYLNDQEYNYDLGFRTIDIDFAFKTAIKWVKSNNIKEKWRKKSERLLADKIDFTSFLVWFIENYPQSHKIMIESPEYQNRFK